MNSVNRINYAFSLALIVSGLAFASAAPATEIEGIKLPDTERVANQELKLNGAAVRYRSTAKLSVVALYLLTRKTSAKDVIELAGPKRISMVLLRDFSNNEYAQAFMGGIKKNSGKSERTKVTNSLLKFGEAFASVPDLKKGDVITGDWVPNEGAVFQLNGKKLGDALPDALFYELFLRIFLGDDPANTGFKQLLLGEKQYVTPRSS